MLSTNIKEATRSAHFYLEKKVIQKMIAIRNDADYAEFLKYFYAYFSQVELLIKPFTTSELLPDHADRRNSSYLKKDIEELGGTTENLPVTTLPEITNTLQALGALYVMEGSVLGGPIIIKMLKKSGITKGFSFYSGYGEATGLMWKKFVAIMDAQAITEIEEAIAIEAANDTFEHFANVFDTAVPA